LKLKDIYKGNYEDPEDLLSKFRYSLSPDERKGISINFHSNVNKISIKLETGFILAFPRELTDLGEILGFQKRELFVGPGFFLADFEPLTNNTYTIHVCSDLIHNQFFGKIQQPILQTVQLNGQRDSLYTRRFQNPPLFPINKDSVREISVELRSVNGQIAPLQKGIVFVTLIIVWP